MLTPAAIRKFYAFVPVWFWPVLAWNLFLYDRWARARHAEGHTNVLIAVTRWGQIEITGLDDGDDASPNWRAGVFRTRPFGETDLTGAHLRDAYPLQMRSLAAARAGCAEWELTFAMGHPSLTPVRDASHLAVALSGLPTEGVRDAHPGVALPLPDP